MIQYWVCQKQVLLPDSDYDQVRPIPIKSPKHHRNCFRNGNKRKTHQSKQTHIISAVSSSNLTNKNINKLKNIHYCISAAAAIRDASSSFSKLEQFTKINHKIETPTAKLKRSLHIDDNDENDAKDAKKERINRYRPAILYDDEDENTSNPKLEKIINEDKERIERERKDLIDKKKSKKDGTSREERGKRKMEASADKFKVFFQADVPDLYVSTSTNEEKVPVNVDKDDDDDEDVVEVETQSPANADLTIGSQASVASPPSSRSNSPPPTTPPAWKVKNKRPSTTNEGSASKRRRNSESPEPDTTNIEMKNLLRGVVFVISGIQVLDNL